MLQPVLTTISPIYPIILLSLILSCYTQRHRTIVDDVQQYEYSESTRSNAILELMETPNSPSACNGPYEEIRFPEQMCFPLYDGTKKCFQIRLPGSGCQCVSGAERNQETGQCEMKTGMSDHFYNCLICNFHLYLWKQNVRKKMRNG